MLALRMLRPNGSPHRLAIHRDQDTPPGAGQVPQEGRDGRLQFLRGDHLRKNAPIRILVGQPGPPPGQRLAQGVRSVGHPVGDATGPILPGELGQDDQNQDGPQRLANRAPLALIGERRQARGQTAHVEDKNLRVFNSVGRVSCGTLPSPRYSHETYAKVVPT